MIIRAAIRSDLGAILRLLRDIGDMAPVQSGTARMSSAAVRAWTRIETDPDRCVLVAESRGQIIGTLDLVIIANLTHDARPWALVDNVVVDSAYRRRGVGSALLDDACDRALSADCYKVELLSRAIRDGTDAFYRSMGFENSAEGFRRYV